MRFDRSQTPVALREWARANKHHRLMRALYGLYKWSRLRRAVHARRTHHPNSRRIEIELTTQCNLRCFNCDMSVRQAPSDERMTPEQIERFVEQSVALDRSWERIRLMGGEPTLHPELPEILELLDRYRRHAPTCRIEIVTNGRGPKVRAVLESLPSWVVVDNSEKTGNVNDFMAFNDAPCDDPRYTGRPFERGCFVASECGMGLSRAGYYPCVVASGIDRIMGYDVGIPRLEEVSSDAQKAQLRRFCADCGYFKTRYGETDTRHDEVMSPRWIAAYSQWRRSPPRLRSF